MYLTCPISLRSFGGNMANIEVPEFLENPKMAWVQCVDHRVLPNDEVVCQIPRVGDRIALVISPARFFKKGRLQGELIAFINDGRLVTFPSGDRVTVPSASVEVP